MSRSGNCLDNAAMESWNSTLKSELGEDFDSPADAKEKLFDYIEVFYNQTRMHSSLDYASPAEFERAAIEMRAAAVSAIDQELGPEIQAHTAPTGCQSPPAPPSIHNHPTGGHQPSTPSDPTTTTTK